MNPAILNMVKYGNWKNLCVLDSMAHEDNSSDEEDLKEEDPSLCAAVRYEFSKYVDRHLGHINGLWVARLDMCELRGIVMYKTFDDVNDLFKEFEGSKYDKVKLRYEDTDCCIFVGEEDWLKMPNAYVDAFENYTK